MKTSRMIDKYKIFAHEYQKKVKKTNTYQYSVEKMDTNQTTKSSKIYGEELKSHLPSFMRRRENPNIFGIVISLLQFSPKIFPRPRTI